MTTQAVVKATKAVRDLKTLSLAERKAGAAAPAGIFVPGLGNVDVAIVDVGSWPSSVLLTITGFSFSSPAPFMIQLHPRQNQFTDNQNNDFPDQFATQVIATDSSSITTLITRIDPDNEGQGWGQDLELDIFVVE